MQLTRLTASVNTGDGYNITSGSVGTVIKDQATGSVYGQRNSNNTFRLDGIQVTELTGNRARLEPSMDAVEEFTLIKGIYPAEFGGVSSPLGETITDPLSGIPFPGAVIPAARINPLSKAIAPFWPTQNNPGDPSRNYVSGFSEAVTNNDYLGRADHRLSGRD